MLPQSVLASARRWTLGRFAAVAALMAVGVVAAFGLVPGTTFETIETQRIVRELALPALAPAASDDGYWREERIRRGDTLGAVLARLGASDPDAMRYFHTDVGARALYQLRPGKALRIETDPDGRIMALRYLLPSGEQLAVDRRGEGFSARKRTPRAATRVELRSATIRSSLFASADAVGLPDAVTMQLADVFSGDIDFLHDLRVGDRFAVVYEMRYVDGEPVDAGRILGAEFVNKGVSYRAFLWRGPDGSEQYYAEDGRSLRKAFLRSPVAFTRITSGFSLARLHPFLHTWRAHKGVDFAAPIGTPVRATGDGKVVLVGRQTGYGNVIMIQHRGAYSTLYAHLSRFAGGLKSGAAVRQGEVIGYVGQTGWATGPHLHYEFRVDHVQRNPLTIALPNAQPVPAEQREAYAAVVTPLAAELVLARGMSLAGGE
jgi:murein DD-endopeptidase MepM/ murein hydrolase activator NlpD